MMGHNRTPGAVQGYEYEKNVFGPAVSRLSETADGLLKRMARRPSDVSRSASPLLT